MDFKTQTSQPAQPVNQPAAQNTNYNQGGSPRRAPGGKRKMLAGVVSALIVLALLALAFVLLQTKQSSAGDSAVDSGKYQALFMTNGQVYFGKLSNLGANYSELTDVYYLQVQQSVQPSTTDAKKTSDANADAAANPQVSLTKLGNELHGPTDKMHVAKDQILFWENLKDDSTVVKAIKEYQNKQ